MPRLGALCLVLLAACGSSSASDGGGGGAPPADGGAGADGIGADDGGADSAIPPVAPRLAVVSADEANALHVSVFDGSTWAETTIPAAGSLALEYPEIAIAADGSMLVTVLGYLGSNSVSAPRTPYFSRFEGGTWSPLAPIPSAPTDLDGRPMAVVFYEGAFIAAYYGLNQGTAYHLRYDLASKQWTPQQPLTGTPAVTDLHLEPGTPGKRYLYLAFVAGSEVYGTPFDPFATGTPTPSPVDLFEGYEHVRALLMQPAGGGDFVRVALADLGHGPAVTGGVVGGSSGISLGLCPFTFDAFVKPDERSKLFVACPGGTEYDIEIWSGELAGSPATLSWSNAETPAHVDSFRARFWPGFGGEIGYVVGTLGTKAVAARIPDGAVTELSAVTGGNVGSAYGP